MVYENQDYVVNELTQEIKDYINTNNEFDKEGVISPSGKLKSIYDWVYALSNYFTVRTMDNSKPDYQIPATSKEYRWINDNYILFIHAFDNIPYIARLNENFEEPLNIFYQLGITKEESPSNLSDYDVKIQKITNDSIILVDNVTKKTYTVKYNFSNDGLIHLSIGN